MNILTINHYATWMLFELRFCGRSFPYEQHGYSLYTKERWAYTIIIYYFDTTKAYIKLQFKLCSTLFIHLRSHKEGFLECLNTYTPFLHTERAPWSISETGKCPFSQRCAHLPLPTCRLEKVTAFAYHWIWSLVLTP